MIDILHADHRTLNKTAEILMEKALSARKSGERNVTVFTEHPDCLAQHYVVQRFTHAMHREISHGVVLHAAMPYTLLPSEFTDKKRTDKEQALLLPIMQELDTQGGHDIRLMMQQHLINREGSVRYIDLPVFKSAKNGHADLSRNPTGISIDWMRLHKDHPEFVEKNRTKMADSLISPLGKKTRHHFWADRLQEKFSNVHEPYSVVNVDIHHAEMKTKNDVPLTRTLIEQGFSVNTVYLCKSSRQAEILSDGMRRFGTKTELDMPKTIVVVKAKDFQTSAKQGQNMLRWQELCHANAVGDFNIDMQMAAGFMGLAFGS